MSATELQNLEKSIERLKRQLVGKRDTLTTTAPEDKERIRQQIEDLEAEIQEYEARLTTGQLRETAPVAVTAVMNTTPPPVNEWRGRQAEMGELQTALENEAIRLIGIVAPGGYGKSALAVKLTERLTLDWLWVSFTQAYGFAQFGRWLLEQLGQAYDEKWDEETLIQQMVRGLTQEPCLLVLDNLETVVTAETDSFYEQFLSRWLATGFVRDKNDKTLTGQGF